MSKAQRQVARKARPRWLRLRISPGSGPQELRNSGRHGSVQGAQELRKARR